MLELDKKCETTITRNKCVICESDSLKCLYTIKDFPVYCGISNNDKKDIVEDQVWCCCTECGCVQINKLINLKILYEVPHNNALGGTWEKHNKDFAKYIIKNSLNYDSVLDVGGGNGIIALMLSDKFKKIYICDTNQSDLKTENNNIIQKKNLLESLVIKENVDVIINSHTLEHFYDPNSAFTMFYKLLKDDGRLIMSFPHVKNMVKDKFTNGICFEHTYFIDENYCNDIALKHGFVLEDVTFFNKHNIFITFTKSNTIEEKHNQLNGFKENTELVDNFFSYHFKNAEEIQSRLNSHTGPKFLWGCHTFSQYLLSFGINKESIDGIFDNDTEKQGRFLYGTNIMTLNPEILSKIKNPMIVVQAGIYTEEITNQIKTMNKNAIVIN